PVTARTCSTRSCRPASTPTSSSSTISGSSIRRTSTARTTAASRTRACASTIARRRSCASSRTRRRRMARSPSSRCFAARMARRSTPGADANAEFFGGDLAGITQAIEDGTLDQLGVTALWLSPFVENTPRFHYDGTHGVTAFHGYWPVNPRAVDPRLGTEADLDALV